MTAFVETLVAGQEELADPIERIDLAAAMAERLVLDAPAHLVDAAVGDVGSDRGAVPAFRQVRFPSPSPEPDVRLPPHPALHKPISLSYAASSVSAHGEGITDPR